MTLDLAEVIIRLTLAVFLGGLIGFEREAHNRPAGFRTHILVCVGSALIMIVSAYGFEEEFVELYDLDPSRIAASVITGIGFLGAGTIIRQEGTIQGLTTAAGIWVVSGIGLAIGIGHYMGALFTTALVLVSLFVLNRVDHIIFYRRKYCRLWIKAKDQPGLLGKIGMLLGNMNINIKKVDLQPTEYDETYHSSLVTLDFMVRIPGYFNSQEFINELSKVGGILEISWQGQDIFFTDEKSSGPF